MNSFELIEDLVSLPAGAYTKAKRLWVMHRGKPVFAFSQGNTVIISIPSTLRLVWR